MPSFQKQHPDLGRNLFELDYLRGWPHLCPSLYACPASPPWRSGVHFTACGLLQLMGCRCDRCRGLQSTGGAGVGILASSLLPAVRVLPVWPAGAWHTFSRAESPMSQPDHPRSACWWASTAPKLQNHLSTCPWPPMPMPVRSAFPRLVWLRTKSVFDCLPRESMGCEAPSCRDDWYTPFPSCRVLGRLSVILRWHTCQVPRCSPLKDLSPGWSLQGQ